MTDEKWRTYPNDRRYEVSDLGRVRWAKTQRVRKLVTIKNGYVTVMIRDAELRKPITRYVHRMVWETFIGPIPDKTHVRHGPNGSQDNRLSQLKLGTPLQNIGDKREHGTQTEGSRHHTSKLTKQQVHEIRLRAHESNTALGREYNVSESTIRRVLSHRAYTKD